MLYFLCIVYVNCKNPFAFALHFLICKTPIHPFPLLRTFTIHKIRFTRQKGKAEGISLTSSTTSTRFTDSLILAGTLLQGAHLCT